MDLNAPGLLRVTEKDEYGNFHKLNENIRNGAFNEWPNEAGFSNLEEHRGPIELKVTGDIPAWAAGSLYRTGPGVDKVETGKGPFRFSHWFDGLAHTHRFEIVASSSDAPSNNNVDHNGTNTNGTGKEAGTGISTNGAGEKTGPSTNINGEGKSVRVFYSSRRQSDHVAESIRQHGTLRSITFAQKADPCVGLLGKVMSVFRREKELTNVAVTVQADMNVARAISNGAVKGEKHSDDGGKAKNRINGSEGASEEAPLELGHRGQAKSLYLATDAAWMSRLDPNTLEPLGLTQQSELHPDLKGPSSAAHGKRDPVTGDFFNYNLEYGLSPTYRIFQLVAKTGEVKILATLRGRGVSAGYIHSFFLTERYVVLCVNSLRLVAGGAMVPVKGNILDALAFEDVPCDWYVIDRGGKGVVGEFKTARGFFFHSTNAFEEGGDVVCEAVWYDDADILYSFYYDVLGNRDGKANEFWRERELGLRLTRYRFPIAKDGQSEKAREKGEGGVVQPEFEIPGPHVGELPTYNPGYALKRHRFVYGVSNRGLSTMFDSIVKTDTEEKSALIWKGPRGHTPGEPIFVPRPGAGKEDEGVVLSVVLDGERGVSYLLCLDAETLEEMGRAECGFAVAFGFHGRMVGAK